jgi:uncharacterized membrane protein YesL
MVILDESDLPKLNQQNYLKETALVLWHDLPGILLAGLLFSLISLPALFLTLIAGLGLPGILLAAVTIGPGWLALCAVISATILREPNTSPLDYFRSFGHFYVRGMALGGLMAIPLIAGTGTLPMLGLNPVPIVAWVGINVDLVTLFFLFTLYLYVCPQIVIYDVGVRLALRNGLLLEMHHLAHTLGMVALAVLLGFLAFKISLLLLIIFPACWLVFVINNFRLVLRLESDRPGNR